MSAGVCVCMHTCIRVRVCVRVVRVCILVHMHTWNWGEGRCSAHSLLTPPFPLSHEIHLLHVS